MYKRQEYTYTVTETRLGGYDMYAKSGDVLVNEVGTEFAGDPIADGDPSVLGLEPEQPNSYNGHELTEDEKADVYKRQEWRNGLKSVVKRKNHSVQKDRDCGYDKKNTPERR